MDKWLKMNDDRLTVLNVGRAGYNTHSQISWLVCDLSQSWTTHTSSIIGWLHHLKLTKVKFHVKPRCNSPLCSHRIEVNRMKNLWHCSFCAYVTKTCSSQEDIFSITIHSIVQLWNSSESLELKTHNYTFKDLLIKLTKANHKRVQLLLQLFNFSKLKPTIPKVIIALNMQFSCTIIIYVNITLTVSWTVLINSG